MGQTSIPWTDYTFNPVRGCADISPGCDNCYAKAIAIRFPDTMGKWGPKDKGVRIVAPPARWEALRVMNMKSAQRKKPTRIFCASAADILEEWTGPILSYHENRSYTTHITNDGSWTINEADGIRLLTYNDVRGRLWHDVRRNKWLTYQFLTKRTNRLQQRLPEDPPINFQLGASAENQEWAEKRFDDLLRSPVATTFASLEPLLGPIDVAPWLQGPRRLEWIIIGGESGTDSRPCEASWIESIVEQCKGAKVPVFVKQMGSTWAKKRGFFDSDFKAEKIHNLPAHLRVREFPPDAIPQGVPNQESLF